MALEPTGLGVLGVQTTTLSNLSARIKKAKAIPAYHRWLANGNAVEFHGWHKPKRIWIAEIVRHEAVSLFS